MQYLWQGLLTDTVKAAKLATDPKPRSISYEYRCKRDRVTTDLYRTDNGRFFLHITKTEYLPIVHMAN